jgi:hypothetical protein
MLPTDAVCRMTEGRFGRGLGGGLIGGHMSRLVITSITPVICPYYHKVCGVALHASKYCDVRLVTIARQCFLPSSDTGRTTNVCYSPLDYCAFTHAVRCTAIKLRPRETQAPSRKTQTGPKYGTTFSVL